MVERAAFQFGGDNDSGVSSPEGYVNPEVARATGTAETPGSTGGPGFSNPGPGFEKQRRKRRTQAEIRAASGVHLNTTAIEKLLISIHVSLAVGLQTPELNLDPVEAQSLAKAIDDVQACYNAVLTPVTQAWLNLMLTAGTIYGTRAVAVYMRRSNETPKMDAPNKSGQGDVGVQQRGNGMARDFVFNPLKIELPN